MTRTSLLLLAGLVGCKKDKDAQTDGSTNEGDSGDTTMVFTPTADTGPYIPGPPNVATSGSSETCLLLWGGNDRVRGPDDGGFAVPLPFEEAPRTIQAWVRTDKLQAQVALSYGRPSPGQGFQIGSDNGFPFVRTGWSSTQVVSGNVFLADDQWHHLLGSWDGTTAYVMVDGVVAGVGTLPGSTLEGDVVAGNTPTGDLSKSWIGWVDDVRIFDVIRDPLTVPDDLEGDAIPGDHLLLWWDFEVPEDSHGPGIEVPDLTGKHHDGLSAGVDTPDFPRCR